MRSSIFSTIICKDNPLLADPKHIPVSQLGTTDDCGFSPFADDGGTSREIAFTKVKARVEGTKLAEVKLGL
ncbi:MAG: hypothetical protein KAH12_02775 [Anaerolineales bacterium]|nr:hypothetical protein [Anaerolineales bacterium]